MQRTPEIASPFSVVRVFRQWLCFVQIVTVNKTFTVKNPFILFEHLHNQHKTSIQI